MKEVAPLWAATKPLSSFMGYKPSFLLHDVVAGIVIAALSIPIAMGYADIAGLPPQYGLYASCIAPFAFALVTGTSHIVFGIDSATAAMTGSMLVVAGVALGTDLTVQVMPILTLFVALFLVLFSVLKAGRFIRLIPMPVMHGFIAGISVTVILTQIPLMLGTEVDMSGPFWADVANVAQSIEVANIPSVSLSVLSAVVILALKRFAPSIPRALVVLALGSAATVLFGLVQRGVVTLDSVAAGFPVPSFPDLSACNAFYMVGAAFAIAVVVALESLLCLESFSIKAGTRSRGDRELLSFGIANVACSFFACPPCSASISRTAAGISAGGKTQAASVISSLIVAAVILFCGPVLQYLPRATLSIIVAIALVEVCDFSKIMRYARYMKAEFLVFAVAFVSVILLGAVLGILLGFVMAVAFVWYREKKNADDELLGAVPVGKYDPRKNGKKRVDPGIDYLVLKMGGQLNFLNIDKTLDNLTKEISTDTMAVVFNLSKVISLDTTATDKIIQFFDMLLSRGIYVKVVRKVRPTNDGYTRFELRQIMHQVKFYPNVPSALMSLKDDLENGIDPQHAIGWLSYPRLASLNEGDQPVFAKANNGPFVILKGDRPTITVISWDEVEVAESIEMVLHARITYLQSQESLAIEAVFDPDREMKSKGYAFTKLEIVHERTGVELARYENDDWEWHVESCLLENAISVIDVYLRKMHSSGRFSARRCKAED